MNLELLEQKKARIRKKNMYKNLTNLYNKLEAISFKEYNDVIDEKGSLMKKLS